MGLSPHCGNRGSPSLLAQAGGVENWEAEIYRCIEAASAQTRPAEGTWSWLNAWPQVLEDLCHRVRDLRELLHQGSMLEFIRQWRESLSAWPVEAGMFLGAHRLANLDRLEQQVLDGFMDPSRSCLQVLSDLRRSLEAGEEREENSPGDESMDAVRVMTIHKSKGLTFDHVYVVNAHGEDARDLLRWWNGAHLRTSLPSVSTAGPTETIILRLKQRALVKLARQSAPSTSR